MSAKFFQYITLNRIVLAACESANVPYTELISRKKSLKLNLLRGVVYLISREMDVHPTVTAHVLNRTRTNIINVARKYRDYLECNDRMVLDYYTNIIEILERNE